MYIPQIAFIIVAILAIVVIVFSVLSNENQLEHEIKTTAHTTPKKAAIQEPYITYFTYIVRRSAVDLNMSFALESSGNFDAVSSFSVKFSITFAIFCFFLTGVRKPDR